MIIDKGRLNIILVLVPVLLFSSASCSSFNKSIRKTGFLNDYSEADLRDSRFVLNMVEVYRDLDRETVKVNAEHIIITLLSGHNQGRGGGIFFIDAVLKEDRYIRKHRPVISASLEITVFDPSSALPLAYVIISEETENTFSSYPYLFRVIRKALKRIGVE